MTVIIRNYTVSIRYRMQNKNTDNHGYMLVDYYMKQILRSREYSHFLAFEVLD